MRTRIVLGVAMIVAATVVPGAAETPAAVADGVEYVIGDNGLPGGHAVIRGDRLYLGSYGLGFRIYDVSNPGSPRKIGEYLPGHRYDAVPDAAQFGSRHIAVLNGTNRGAPQTPKTEFLDVTDPASPRVLWTFDGAADGEAHNGELVQKRRIWLPSGGNGRAGLRIYDVNPVLETPAKPPVELFSADPVTLWRTSPHRRGRAVGAAFTHTHDITLYADYPMLLPRWQWRDRNGDRRPDPTFGPRDIILLAEGGSYANTAGDTGSVFVIDVTNPVHPVVMFRWLHERGPGHHPIRYHHEAQFLDGDNHLMLVTDEDFDSGCGKAGGITAIRLWANLTDGAELSEWQVPAETNRPVCSTHVFSSHGKTIFMGAYNAGLQILDYSEPARPRRIGYYTAEGATSWGAYWHKGYVYMGDMARGLDVLKITIDTP